MAGDAVCLLGHLGIVRPMIVGYSMAQARRAKPRDFALIGVSGLHGLRDQLDG
jgi:hypothetical protein